jgi:hypothetical protein
MIKCTFHMPVRKHKKVRITLYIKHIAQVQAALTKIIGA